MTGPLLIVWIVLWATLVRALLVRARVLPPTCARCARPLERRELGEQVCRCRGNLD
jgi:hypothetical protein